MKFGKLVKRAVRTRNARDAGKVAEVLRFQHGFNYYEIHDFVNRIAPIDLHDWEALMYEVDTEVPNF